MQTMKHYTNQQWAALMTELRAYITEHDLRRGARAAALYRLHKGGIHVSYLGARNALGLLGV